MAVTMSGVVVAPDRDITILINSSTWFSIIIPATARDAVVSLLSRSFYAFMLPHFVGKHFILHFCYFFSVQDGAFHTAGNALKRFIDDAEILTSFQFSFKAYITVFATTWFTKFNGKSSVMKIWWP